MAEIRYFNEIDRHNIDGSCKIKPEFLPECEIPVLVGAQWFDPPVKHWRGIG